MSILTAENIILSKPTKGTLSESRITILKGISATFESGKLNAIMGANGCGKTTFLNILCGHWESRTKTSGRILLNGKERAIDYWIDNVSYVQQENYEIKSQTARSVIQFTINLRNAETGENNQVKDYMSLYEDLYILDVLDKSVDVLSGGELQRVLIVAELVMGRKILVLDEPTSDLDSHLALELLICLKNLAVQKDIMVIFTIHQPSDQIFKLFDNLLFIHSGKVVYSGVGEGIEQFLKEKNIIRPEEWPISEFIFEVFYDNPNFENFSEESSYDESGLELNIVEKEDSLLGDKLIYTENPGENVVEKNNNSKVLVDEQSSTKIIKTGDEGNRVAGKADHIDTVEIANKTGLDKDGILEAFVDDPSLTECTKTDENMVNDTVSLLADQASLTECTNTEENMLSDTVSLLVDQASHTERTKTDENMMTDTVSLLADQTSLTEGTTTDENKTKKPFPSFSDNIVSNELAKTDENKIKEDLHSFSDNIVSTELAKTNESLIIDKVNLFTNNRYSTTVNKLNIQREDKDCNLHLLVDKPAVAFKNMLDITSDKLIATYPPKNKQPEYYKNNKISLLKAFYIAMRRIKINLKSKTFLLSFFSKFFSLACTNFFLDKIVLNKSCETSLSYLLELLSSSVDDLPDSLNKTLGKICKNPVFFFTFSLLQFFSLDFNCSFFSKNIEVNDQIAAELKKNYYNPITLEMSTYITDALYAIILVICYLFTLVCLGFGSLINFYVTMFIVVNTLTTSILARTVINISSTAILRCFTDIYCLMLPGCCNTVTSASLFWLYNGGFLVKDYLKLVIRGIVGLTLLFNPICFIYAFFYCKLISDNIEVITDNSVGSIDDAVHFFIRNPVKPILQSLLQNKKVQITLNAENATVFTNFINLPVFFIYREAAFSKYLFLFFFIISIALMVFINTLTYTKRYSPYLCLKL